MYKNNFIKSVFLGMPFFILLVFCLFIKILRGDKLQDRGNVTIGFTGDVMIGRTVNEVIDEKGYKYIWGNMLPLLQKNDLNIINLETTLTTSQDRVSKIFNFKAAPDKVKALTLANINIANLANNHIRDFGDSGLEETISVLDKANILHVGAGMNESEARKPVIITKKGIKIGIIGYTDNEPTWEAIGDKPGTNYVKVGNIAKVKEDISKLRDKVDILIFSIHWGPNWVEKPSQEFIDFAHSIIDLGVDILHGHSAHNFQGIEIYKNKLIMYQTGDFIDDYAIDPERRNDQSFLFNVKVNKKGLNSVKLIPTIISHMQVNKLEGKEAKVVIKKIQALSKEFDTKISDDGLIVISN